MDGSVLDSPIIRFLDLSPSHQDLILKLPNRLQHRLVCRKWTQIINPAINTLIVNGPLMNWASFPHLQRIILTGPPELAKPKLIEPESTQHELIQLESIEPLSTEPTLTKPDPTLTWQGPPGLNHLDLIQWIPNLGWLAQVQVKHLTWMGNLTHSGNCLFNLFTDVSSNPSITELTLIDKQSWCRECLPLYGQMSYLTSFEMISASDMTLNQIRQLRNLPSLTHLTLIDCDFDEAEHVQTNLVEAILDLPYLKSVCLSEGLLSTESWACLSQVPGLSAAPHVPIIEISPPLEATADYPLIRNSGELIIIETDQLLTSTSSSSEEREEENSLGLSHSGYLDLDQLIDEINSIHPNTPQLGSTDSNDSNDSL
jgi:hypothetical protein